MIDLTDYYAGGYFLIRENNPYWIVENSDLLPKYLLSLSRCICPHLDFYQDFYPSEAERAISYGIPERNFAAVDAWARTYPQTEITATSMFYSLDGARLFVERFVENTEDLHIIGAGLYKPLESAGWIKQRQPTGTFDKFDIDVNLLLNPSDQDMAPDADRTNWHILNHSRGQKIEDIEDQIKLHLPLAEGGTPLGFEIISYYHRDFSHSWFCSSIHLNMHNLFGIRPGQYGLIQTREAAETVDNWIAEDNQQGHRAEPEPYAYWLLVSYPLTS